MPGEALSSWLRRIAARYDASLEDIVSDLGHALGPPGHLDTCQPAGLARELAHRTGVDVYRIQRMSFSGWTPWVVDQMDPDPEAFRTYTRQFPCFCPKEGDDRG